MKSLKKLSIIVVALLSINMLALNVIPQLQDDRTRPNVRNRRQDKGPITLNKRGKAKDDSLKNVKTGLSALVIEDDSIPDSLLHPKWNVQRTVPITHRRYEETYRRP